MAHRARLRAHRVRPRAERVSAGDGTADLSGVVICPYCGEQSEVALDPGSGAHQAYVEDCPVCCQPWSVRVEYAGDGSARVEISALE
jgi:cysteine-rich CPXCG protein